MAGGVDQSAGTRPTVVCWQRGFDLTRDCLKAANEPGTHHSVSRSPLLLLLTFIPHFSGPLSILEVTRGQGLSKGQEQ